MVSELQCGWVVVGYAMKFKERKFGQPTNAASLACLVVMGCCMALQMPVLPNAKSASLDAAEFYRGKTVRILVGSPPGGGYDIYARLIVPALAAKLGATVLVENKDGNGGLAALATLMVRPADGLTIMNGSAEAGILSQMLERPGVNWDVSKLNWLAKLSSAPKLWFVGKTPHYGSIAEAVRA